MPALVRPRATAAAALSGRVDPRDARSRRPRSESGSSRMRCWLALRGGRDPCRFMTYRRRRMPRAAPASGGCRDKCSRDPDGHALDAVEEVRAKTLRLAGQLDADPAPAASPRARPAARAARGGRRGRSAGRQDQKRDAGWVRGRRQSDPHPGTDRRRDCRRRTRARPCPPTWIVRSVQLDVARGGSAEVQERRRPAEDLLHRAGDQRGVGEQPVALRRMFEERQQPVRHRVAGRLVPGRHQQQEEQVELVLGQAVPVDVGLDQAGGEVVSAADAGARPRGRWRRRTSPAPPGWRTADARRRRDRLRRPRTRRRGPGRYCRASGCPASTRWRRSSSGTPISSQRIRIGQLDRRPHRRSRALARRTRRRGPRGTSRGCGPHRRSRRGA